MARGQAGPLLVLVAVCCAVGPSAATCTEAFLQGVEMEPAMRDGTWNLGAESCTWPQTGGEFESFGAPTSSPDAHAEDGHASNHLRGVREVADASGRRHLLGEGVRVLHDLDDTLTCSGGRPLRGIDARCYGTEPGHLYPGVVELFYALSLGPYAEGEWGGAPASPTVPFSARVRRLSFLLGVKPCVGDDLQFRQRICGCAGGKAGCRRGDADCTCFGIDTVRAQYGSLQDAFSRDGTFTSLGRTKFSNWYSNIYGREQKPTVFFGDNGQGDLIAAQWMLITSQKLDPKKGGTVAAFIHDVQQPPACASEACRSAWARHNVFFYQDYREAASTALGLGLISADFAGRIAATVDLAAQLAAAPAKNPGFMSSLLSRW